MMMTLLLHNEANLVSLSTLIVGIFNLIIPLVTKSFWRLFLLILNSSAFLINVLILDWLYFAGFRINLTFFSVGKFALSMHLEPLGLIFLSLISLLWIFAIIYSCGYLKINNIYSEAKFIFFLNLCILIGALLSFSANLITMFVFYELLSVVTIPLIVHIKSKEVLYSLDKYLKILFFTSIGLFLPFIIIIYYQIGNSDFILAGFIKDHFSVSETKILLLLVVFGISKTALAPFFSWLTAAMIAPYPVSALLHAVVVVKAGLFCLFKIIVYVFGLGYLHEIFVCSNMLLLLPLFTIVYCSVKACLAKNIKMILAYSTINNLSISLMSAFLFTPKAMLAALLHMLSHSVAKICLFYGMGALYSLKKVVAVNDLKFLGYKLPATSIIICLSMLSLIGIPPFGGFISKFYLLSAAMEEQRYLVISAIIFSSLLSAYYFTQIWIELYDSAYLKDHSLTLNNENKLPQLMLFSLVACCSLTILFFVFLPLIVKLTFYLS